LTPDEDTVGKESAMMQKTSRTNETKRIVMHRNTNERARVIPSNLTSATDGKDENESDVKYIEWSREAARSTDMGTSDLKMTNICLEADYRLAENTIRSKATMVDNNQPQNVISVAPSAITVTILEADTSLAMVNGTIFKTETRNDTLTGDPVRSEAATVVNNRPQNFNDITSETTLKILETSTVRAMIDETTLMNETGNDSLAGDHTGNGVVSVDNEKRENVNDLMMSAMTVKILEADTVQAKVNKTIFMIGSGNDATTGDCAESEATTVVDNEPQNGGPKPTSANAVKIMEEDRDSAVFNESVFLTETGNDVISKDSLKEDTARTVESLAIKNSSQGDNNIATGNAELESIEMTETEIGNDVTKLAEEHLSKNGQTPENLLSLGGKFDTRVFRELATSSSHKNRLIDDKGAA